MKQVYDKTRPKWRSFRQSLDGTDDVLEILSFYYIFRAFIFKIEFESRLSLFLLIGSLLRLPFFNIERRKDPALCPGEKS